MNRYTTTTLLGLLLLLGASGATARQAMEPGSWAFDIEYDLIGIPQTFPGYTVTQCIDDTTPYPSISRPGHECQMQTQGHFGRTYTWLVNCSSDWEMVQGAGRIHYYQETARGDVHLQILNPHNPPQPMLFRIKGRHLGPCDK
jgi:hypothetical protein